MFGRITAMWRELNRERQRLFIGLAAGAAMPIASAGVAAFLEERLDVHAPNMVFLCSVIFAAIWFGRRVALATALLAFFCYNFYLVEPRDTFGFAGWEDVLTLLTFVGVAMLVGNLAGKLHDQRERAEEQVRIFSGLFSVSRSMAEITDADTATRALADGARQVAAAEAAILSAGAMGAEVSYHSPASAAPPISLLPVATEMLEGRTLSPPARTDADGWRLQLVQAGGKPVAVLAWKHAPSARTQEHTMAMRLLAEITSAAIERRQFLQRQVEIDTMTATDRLRTALMSSISHDFRTPLSTILTSATSLLAYDSQFSAATRADLLVSIQEEAERLNRFVGNILDMTRLDAGVVTPHEEWTDPLEILDNVEERMRRRMSGRVFKISAPAAVPAIFVDPVLLEQALTNVIENALVYTPAAAPITLAASYDDTGVSIWVEDAGPGVPHHELPRLFDKFHRVERTQNSQGAGLGLAITKGFVEAMNGSVNASPGAGGHGLKIALRFPLETEVAPA